MIWRDQVHHPNKTLRIFAPSFQVDCTCTV
jgi:hypothetical protein